MHKPQYQNQVFLSLLVRLLLPRYNAAALEPGAKDDFTHGLRTRPSSLALRANKPAATVLRGFEVLVHEVIAADNDSAIWH